MLVVGDDDVEARTVGVNRRGSDEPERGVPLDAFLAELPRRPARAAPLMPLERLWAGWRAPYLDEVTGDLPPSDECLFCRLAAADPDEAFVVARDDHAFVVLNAYPYTSGHVMVAPLRHEGDLEALPADDATALMNLTQPRHCGGEARVICPTA